MPASGVSRGGALKTNSSAAAPGAALLIPGEGWNAAFFTVAAFAWRIGEALLSATANCANAANGRVKAICRAIRLVLIITLLSRHIHTRHAVASGGVFCARGSSMTSLL